jgi:hypothetical protein
MHALSASTLRVMRIDAAHHDGEMASRLETRASGSINVWRKNAFVSSRVITDVGLYSTVQLKWLCITRNPKKLISVTTHDPWRASKPAERRAAVIGPSAYQKHVVRYLGGVRLAVHEEDLDLDSQRPTGQLIQRHARVSWRSLRSLLGSFGLVQPFLLGEHVHDCGIALASCSEREKDIVQSPSQRLAHMTTLPTAGPERLTLE